MPYELPAGEHTFFPGRCDDFPGLLSRSAHTLTLPRDRFPTVTKSTEFEFHLPQGARTLGALKQVVSLQIFGVNANATRTALSESIPTGRVRAS